MQMWGFALLSACLARPLLRSLNVVPQKQGCGGGGSRPYSSCFTLAKSLGQSTTGAYGLGHCVPEKEVKGDYVFVQHVERFKGAV